MPLITTVLNYLRGEPSAKNTGDDHPGKQSVNELPSPSRSPRLVQKLNKIQDGARKFILNLEKNEISQSKKRARTDSFDEDDEVVTSSQKKSRIYISISDGVGCSPSISDEGALQNETNVTDLRKHTVSTESDDVDVDDYTDCLKNNVMETSPKNRENITIENEVIENSTAGNNDRGCSDLEVEVGDEVTSSREHENENKPDTVSFCLKNQNIPTEVSVERTTTNSGCERELTVNNAVKDIEPALEMDTACEVPILGCEKNNVSTSTSICTKNKDEKMQLDKEKHNKNEDVLVPSLPCGTDEQQDEENKIQETLIAQQISEGFLTDSMLDQEKILHQQHLEEEKEIVNQAMAEWDSTIEQQRYNRLQHLLEKSNVYSSFLLQRIEKQKAENEKAKARQAKKVKKGEDGEAPQTVPELKGGRKPKGMSSSYNITDYVDQEALRKSSKASNPGPVSTSRECHKVFSVGQTSKNMDSDQNEAKTYIQPKLLTGGSLRDYQIEGVEWLKVLFENGVNGILADEMGLGKTIQCIALLAHLIEMGVSGPYLVTAPLSTLPNWVSEFKRFTPKIPVILYHGNVDERSRLRRMIPKLQGDATFKAHPVVITSYEIVMRDRKFLDKYTWKYVIVDEGHRIKNLKCKLIRELKAYPSANRLLLTGTPLQNNLSELWSLLNFLLPDIFDDLNSFQAWFDFSAIRESGGNEKIIAQEREHHVLERLHAILTPFLLRRLKTDVNIDIPRKKEVVVYAPLTQKQEYWYKLFLDKSRLHDHFKKNKNSETPTYSPSGRALRRSSRKVNYEIFDSDSIDYDELMEKLKEEEDKKIKSKNIASTPQTCERNVKLINVLMQLRKTCNHPYLLEYPLIPGTQQYRIDEELITCCGKTLILDQMLAALKERGHKVLLFSQMTKLLDILEDFCYLRKYRFSRLDGSMKFEDRQVQIEDFNSDPDVSIFLLSTRAGGLGLNLTAADTVILYDSDWNPQQDLQAQDRCHRIGQTKPVVVYRFLTSNTVDQKIVERAADKRKLEKMIIHKGKFKGVRDDKILSANEMLDLLQSSEHMNVVNTDNNNTQVLSKEQLRKLLDRSDLLGECPVDSTACDKTEDESKFFKVIGIAE